MPRRSTRLLIYWTILCAIPVLYAINLGMTPVSEDCREWCGINGRVAAVIISVVGVIWLAAVVLILSYRDPRPREADRVRPRVPIIAVVPVAASAIWLLLVLIEPFRGLMSEGRGFDAGIRVENQTNTVVTVEAFADEEEWIRVATALPGQFGSVHAGFGDHSRIGRDLCTTVPLRALDARGRVLERHDPPQCDGDVWTIEGRDG